MAKPVPAVGGERRRAIEYVSGLVRQYRALLASPRCYAREGLARHVRELVDEIATMQIAGAAGDTHARRWCFLAGC